MKYREAIQTELEILAVTHTVEVGTKERKGATAEVLMATPCTNSLERKKGRKVDDSMEVKKTAKIPEKKYCLQYCRTLLTTSFWYQHSSGRLATG